MGTKKIKTEKINAESIATQSVIEDAKLKAMQLVEEAKKAADAAKEAKKLAKEAMNAAKSFTSRPLRLSYFEARFDDNSVLFKSDVHYITEKAAIDYLTELRNTNSKCSKDEIVIYKINKNSKQSIEVSKLCINKETNQIIIE